MTAYATQADLLFRFGEPMLLDLTDRATPPAGAIDAAVVTAALNDASAAIDGYLKDRYALPIASDVPPLLRDLVQAIAIYKLHRSSAPDKIRDDYTDALKTLSLISGGTIRLNVAGVEPTSSGSSGVKTTDRDRALTNKNMKGFI